MQALIDGDLVAYRCSASAEAEPVEIAKVRADKLMRQLLDDTKADSYRCFLSGGHNFRKDIDPNYKANRTQPRPIHLEDVREFLVLEWKAEVTDGIEADDAMGIAQDKEGKETTIVSLDKDMLQVPGLHYRWGISGAGWVKDPQWLNISYEEGLLSFYISALVGDVSDNIRGAAGIGKAKAPRLLSGLHTEQEMYKVSLEMYNGDQERLNTNLKLLWIMRKEGDIFCPISRGLMADESLSSQVSSEVVSDDGHLNLT